MNGRALIFEDEQDIGKILKSFLELKAYEVFTFQDPVECPLNKEKRCPCSDDERCADIILSDIRMPFKNGLDFLEEQILKGCKCPHFALMSGAFTEEEALRADSLGIKIFRKPFNMTQLFDWLEQFENDIGPERKLTDWFLKGKGKSTEQK